ncbi:MAG TPA: imidazolonepropionase [Thermoplasmatales archaeon]|nr:imidazolonepropionase [Thermoplasmatales archaeon]
MKKHVDLLIRNASEIVTLRDYGRPRKGSREMNDIGITKDGFIAIDSGKIVDIGKSCHYNADEIIDAKGKTVIPGFVDAHTHLAFSGYRDFELDLKLRGASYTDILNAGGGINYTVKLTRKASKEELAKRAEERLNVMLAHGTTTCEAKSGYGLDKDTEIRILEVYRELNKNHPIDIVSTFLGAHAFPDEFRGRENDYVSFIADEVIPEVAERGLAEFCDVFLEKGFFNRDQARRILMKGKEYNLIPKIHADELSYCGGAVLAAEINAISADHLLKISDEGIERLASSKTIAVLLPATVLSLMEKEFAPARKLIESKIPVALATDLNPNCYTENMQLVIQLACYYMKMTPAEALVASTINAAYAIGKEHEVGSLDIGKQADIVILDCPSYTFIPYHFGVNLVEKVIKKGKIVCENQF